ncbi:mannosyltransferase PIG-V [Jatrophihabitans sp. GAS493]|uniref:mannosyltransferase family protein n=1 Tax=Jatrophihabitans sp. GAS493 TaxID=1907575 RepID=UPI000BC07E64|nr:mannosyltransferase family protein [Jatrophihabitans sp. GAS493]SOD73269.1 mannosyltransferase PIG-V [Jatrophihabitans sp. GAS493]
MGTSTLNKKAASKRPGKKVTAPVGSTPPDWLARFWGTAEAPSEFRAFAGPIVALVLGVKLFIYMIGVIANEVFSNTGFNSMSARFDIWNRWDAPHYLSIAQYGYQTSGDPANFVVFFPGYPWMVRIFAVPLGGNYLLAAFAVSTVASIAAALLLGYLVRGDSGDSELALRAVWFFLIFPTSYFLHLPYTESLFMACILGTFLAARMDKWLLAGIAGALATLTRINGLVLLPALAVEAYSQYRATGRIRLQWLWIALAGLGVAVYLYMNYHVYGRPFAFMTVQREHWYKTLQWPWTGIHSKIEAGHGAKPGDKQMLVDQELLYIVIGAVATIATWIWLRPSYAIWMTGNWLLFTSTSYILSTPRYTLTLFPIFILLAKVGRNRIVAMLVSVWSILFLGLFTSLFAIGQWAY